MPRLFWPNFDFEHELATGQTSRNNLKLRQLNAKFAPVLAALCQSEDRLVWPLSTSPPSRRDDSLNARFVLESEARFAAEYGGRDWELIPWGVTASMQRLAESREWNWRQPSVEIVKTWNDRVTSVSWEAQDDSSRWTPAIIASMAEFESLMASDAHQKWIIKARFGMSGRERIMGSGSEMTETQRRWLEKRLQAQGSVIWEPELEIIEEVGIQFEVEASGQVRFLAAWPLINAPTGAYSGSRMGLTPDETTRWRSVIDTVHTVASKAGAEGYFGPFGMDAIRYRTEDGVRVRPVMDINARWTMGRIAWEWGQRTRSSPETVWRISDFMS